MSLIFSVFGIVVFSILVIFYVYWARRTVLGGLSLPCLVYLTSLVYFFLIPGFFVASGQRRFFGVALANMDGVYLAVLLYALGAAAAFWLGKGALVRPPLMPPGPAERTHNPTIYWALFGLASAAVAGRVDLGIQIIGTEAQDLGATSGTSAPNFLNLGYSVLIALVTFRLIKTNFSLPSLLLLGILISFFLVEGFRFRIVVVLTAAALAFLITRRIQLRTLSIALGTVFAIILVNALGIARSYGRGLSLDRLEGMGWQDLFSSFGGEVGPVFTLYNITADTPRLIYTEPWVNTLTNFIPAFLWPGKPYPEYLKLYSAGFPDPNARAAGIAATQHTEFLLQFGWIGLPILAFVFFTIAIFLLRRVQRLGLEGRVAGFAVIPALFGFYAQQRGYTFQVVAEVMFTLGPIFLLYLGGGRRWKRRPVPAWRQ